MAEVMTVKIDAEDVMERLMDDCLIEGKSLRQWIKSIVDHKWIPCSAALPADMQTCLTTQKIYFTPDHVDEIDWYIGIGINTYTEKYGWLDHEPIAWMPLPEPYKAGDGSE